MKKLTQILSDVLRIDESKITDDLAIHQSQAWNSLTHIELVLMIEEAFEIQLTEDEIVAMTSVREIKKVLHERGLNAE